MNQIDRKGKRRAKASVNKATGPKRQKPTRPRSRKGEDNFSQITPERLTTEDDVEETPEQLKAKVRRLAPLIAKANAAPPSSKGSSSFTLADLLTERELEVGRATGLM